MKKYGIKLFTIRLKKLDNSNFPRNKDILENNFNHSAILENRKELKNKEILKGRNHEKKEIRENLDVPRNELSEKPNLLPLCFFASDSE